MHLKLITLVPRGPSKTNTTVQVLWFLTVALMCTKCIQCLSIGQIRDQVSTEEIIGNMSASPEDNTTYAPNSTLSSARNSRQLWSFVKNVIKTSLDQKQQNDSPVSSGLGALASLIGSGIASGISSDSASVATSHLQNSAYPPPPAAPSPGNHFGMNSPNDYMHYLLLNSQSNQHTSLPHFQQQQQQSTSQLIEKYQQEVTSPVTNTASVSSTGNQILSKLALGSILDDFDLDKVSNFLSFGNFESMVEKVNKFDKLKCIPRMLCQMVAKRAEDERKEKVEEERRATTTTTTKRPTKAKRKSDEKDDVSGEKDRLRSETPKGNKDENADKGKLNQKQDEEDDDNENEDDDDDDENDDDDEDDEEESDEKEYVVIKQGSVRDKNEASGEKEKSTPEGRTGRVFKINGADTALEQFVKFLELMQLKDWSLYPYLQGAYQGHQVTRTDECAYKYPTCPFSDDQLVYYFNNYNGGFFQSI